ncbi:MAG: SpoIIE family protein phosphatase [Bacteroides sp.]|nr:SpoIIE family protein phosphatase [Prevotella sp.]MCM1407457.1 SpoIIE family protein phosphatase [Treponema brennaborense]MCM1469947.1 SpoIIE family protein phosphatase [Bacteroides sp.]
MLTQLLLPKKFVIFEQAFSLSALVPYFCIAAVIFAVLYVCSSQILTFYTSWIEKKALMTHETALLSRFMDKLRFCYTLDDFIDAVQTVLEVQAGCAVLYIDRENNYVIYNSPDRVSCSDETARMLELNYTKSWNPGYFFMDLNFGVVSRIQDARGFFLVCGTKHLYVFCRYTRLFDPVVFQQLFDEFSRFEKRAGIISGLSEIAELSKEWSLLAETQRSFLPQTMPETRRLDVASYFRPLVNVSGDYYTVLPIDEHKTLVMLGDVSGKGLAAALVMGVVMNTVKIMQDKEDLVSMVQAVDKAVKGMKLQDKYTVLFLGVIDTKKMIIRYINASMSDPIIVTQTPAGYKVKPLASNCSLVGIIDLDDVEVADQKLYNGDLIFMASDGVSEVMDENGVELGNTELYMNTVQTSAAKSASAFIDDIANLVLSYNGDKKLRDDVTMLAAKLEK